MTPQEFQAALNKRNLRLASGLLLFAYVATHLLNHAAGLVSLAAAEEVRPWFTGFWRHTPAALLLYAAFAFHIALAYLALYERHTLRMPLLEAVRVALGFYIPFALAQHYAGTQIAHVFYGQQDPYVRIAWSFWLRDNAGALWPLIIISTAWTHGCIGLHLVLRHRAGYRRRFYWLFALACLLPVLGLAGFVNMAHEIALRMADPAWYPAQMARIDVMSARQKAMIEQIADGMEVFFAALLALVFVLRGVRAWRTRHDGRSFLLTYPAATVRVPAGWSVLEASRANGIPHLSLCGGRARCSTCRIEVDGPQDHCPPPGAIEQRTLQRIGTPAGVRLACQLRPTGDLKVTPLLPVLEEARSHSRFGAHLGAERNLVILFIDLRRWTTLSQQQLPFDLVYVLEQYFEAVGAAVLEAGGVPNQFIGDSVMAIFGLETGHAEACGQALAAARGIAVRLRELSTRMQAQFGQAVDFGIGIHAGRAAVGAVGYQETRTLTAVGDAVNTASRLQELTKTYGVQLVISEPVASGAALDTAGYSADNVQIRGRSGLLRVYAIPSPEQVHRFCLNDA